MRLKIVVFWDVTPCTLVNRYQRFGGICCLHLQGDTEGSSKVFDNMYQTTRRYILEECYIRNDRRDKINFLLDEVDFWLSDESVSTAEFIYRQM
jgi:hypothetical protein